MNKFSLENKAMPANEEDTTRRTLQSFVGPHISDTKLSQRQKDAIQRLIYLSESKFHKLCEDIINEIHHRSGMKHSKESPMYEKLTNLSEEKFRNLVIDTLLVYNYKHPGTEAMHMDEFLDNLEVLTENLKNQSLNENFTNKIKKMEPLSVFSEYNRYVEKTTTTDPEIIKSIDRVINETITKKSTQLLDCLGYPEKFLEVLDQTDLKNDEEYLYHKENILELIKSQKEIPNNNKDCSINNKEYSITNETVNTPSTKAMVNDMKNKNRTGDKTEDHKNANVKEAKSLSADTMGKTNNHTGKLIKTEMILILSMYINRACIPVRQIRCLQAEIKVVLNALDSIKEDLNGRLCVNLQTMSKELNGVIGPMIEKLKSEEMINIELINRLKMHQVLLEGMEEAATKMEAFRMVVGLANDIGSVFDR